MLKESGRERTYSWKTYEWKKITGEKYEDGEQKRQQTGLVLLRSVGKGQRREKIKPMFLTIWT